MSDPKPLRASTPKKSKLSSDSFAAEGSQSSSYLFVSDSEDYDANVSSPPMCSQCGKADTSELLFLTSGEADPSESSSELLFLSSKDDVSLPSDTADSSILFLSNDTSTLIAESSDDEEELPNKNGSFINRECCKEHCLLSFSLQEFNDAAEHFQSKTSTEQRQYLLDSLILSAPLSTNPGPSSSPKEKFMVYCKPVCLKGFARLLGTTERRVERVKQFGASGKIVHGNLGIKRPTDKRSDASAWMKSYFMKLGDHMPDSNRIHLPSFLTKREIFNRMCAELLDDGIIDTVSLSTFYDIWDKEYTHVLIPEETTKPKGKGKKVTIVEPTLYKLKPPFIKCEDMSGKYRPLIIEDMKNWPMTTQEYIDYFNEQDENRFSKCDTCVKINLELEKSSKSTKVAITAMKKKHLLMVETERKIYHHHRQKARSMPEKYMCIIIDGMDQNKTNLPSLRKAAKSTTSLYRLRTHLTGVLDHTRSDGGKKVYVFMDILQFPHDSNLTTSIISRILFLHQKRNNGVLPSVLYVQMDNTSRENKNKFVMGYFALLVEVGIFRKVKLNFLPVGHTHEDVDQLFSRISQRLARTGAESLPELESVLNAGYTPKPAFEMLYSVADYKSIIEPVVADIHRHTKPLVFRFLKDQSGHVQLHYRHKSSDKDWLPKANEDTLQILTALPDIDELTTVIPSGAKLDLDHLRRDIPKYFPFLQPASKVHWEKFMEEELPILMRESGARDHKDHFRQLIAAGNRQSPACTTSPVVEPQSTSSSEEEEIFIGKKQKKRNEQKSTEELPVQVSSSFKRMSDKTVIQPSSIVAVYLEKYPEFPQIGQVRTIHQGCVTLSWYDGAFSDVWSMVKLRKGEEWIEKIEINSIILYDIVFTKGQRLKKDAQLALREYYDQFVGKE